MRLVLDSGAFLALERGERTTWRHLKIALRAEQVPVSHGGVVGQVWRGRGPRQALLAAALAAVEVRSLDEDLGRAAGAILAKARKHDVIDAAIVLCAEDGDRIVTSDQKDLYELAEAAGRRVELLSP